MNKYLFYIPASYWICQAIAYFLLIFTLIYISPNIIQNNPRVTFFAEILSTWVPMLGEINKASGFAQSLVFYYSVIWVATPILALGLIGFGAIHQKIKATAKIRISAPLFPILAGLSFWITCLIIAMFWPINHESYSWRDRMLLGNAFGFSYFGLMTMWVWSLFFGYIYILMERLFYTLRKSISREKIVTDVAQEK